MPFPEPLDVRIMPDGKYQLLHRFIYVAPNGGEIIVPQWFDTDFASIPRGFRWLFTGHDATRKPAVIHDYLYNKGIGTRLDADRLFRLCMKESGVPGWKRHLAYAAVRLSGGFTWGK